jgi:hypothetical protein
VLAIGAAAALVSSSASAQLSPRIVHGLDTQGFASVGALLRGNDPSSADSQCTGTLIGCSTFLTAAHCVCPGVACTPDPSDYKVYLAHAGVFAVQSITARSDFSFPVGDLAIVKLAKPVNGIRPSEIDTTQAPPFGTPGTIVGFGRSGGASFDYGLKRYGAVSTSACPLLVSPTTSVCWTFEAPIGPPGLDSNSCNGDSGGPLFVDFGAGPLVAGVTSGGTSDDCLATDQSYDANVYTYRSWTLANGGADLDEAACGALPQVGDPGTRTFDIQGSLSSAAPDRRASFPVPPETRMLRVGMNAVDDGVANFDLYVKRGAAPTPTSFDCARTGSTQYGVCDFAGPATDTWHVLVHRLSGSGAYQVTATEFGPSALTVDLSSSVTTVAPGEPFPLTLTIANRTGGGQRFAVFAALLTPDGTPRPLIGPRGMPLGDGGTFTDSLTVDLPLGLPLGTWRVGAVLWQPDAGFLDQAMLSFEIR